MTEDDRSGKPDTPSRQFRINTGTSIVITNKRPMGARADSYLLNALPGLAFLISALIFCSGVLAIQWQPG